MSTINSKSTIDELIANNGYHPGDPQVYMIVEYTNYYGNTTWGVTWQDEANQEKYLVESKYVRNPKIIWKANNS